ncbi:MAG: hypothetical protein NC926_05030 [Candidatus Omnitrophica bacterium]|nr:hypothetical protein [Candidatus Omnitrophota bacterium]MCM8807304.1 hypothetical protein [Candidatus Omnitrophota bacterium]
MIDWGKGFYLGFKIAFLFIVLGIEFYFFVFEKMIEKEFSISETIIFSVLFLISILVVVLKMSIISIFIPPLGFVIIYFLQKQKENILTDLERERRIEELKKIIEQQPDNFTAYSELGDIYFKKEDYKKALDFYKIAYRIKNLPWIKHKIEVTDRLVKIEEGVIWVCRNCGSDNLREDEKCKSCGEEKEVLKSIKKDLKQTKKYFVFLIFIPFGVIIAYLILFFLPLYFSVFIFLLLLYFLVRYFFTY